MNQQSTLIDPIFNIHQSRPASRSPQSTEVEEILDVIARKTSTSGITQTPRTSPRSRSSPNSTSTDILIIPSTSSSSTQTRLSQQFADLTKIYCEDKSKRKQKTSRSSVLAIKSSGHQPSIYQETAASSDLQASFSQWATQESAPPLHHPSTVQTQIRPHTTQQPHIQHQHYIPQQQHAHQSQPHPQHPQPSHPPINPQNLHQLQHLYQHRQATRRGVQRRRRSRNRPYPNPNSQHRPISKN